MTRDEARAKLVELTGIVPHSLSLAARIEAAIDAFEAAVLRVVPPEGGPRNEVEELIANLNATPSDGPTLTEVVDWLRNRPGVSWLATLHDIEWAVTAIRAAERGVSAVPPTEEPNE